ncbi:MAG: phospholipid carrier-dependent glycosyltransferase [Verrucomicrobia bacterium]|nr:phospholipid carrier-dependent glycosyltransferase [Verrucomicrobiota bacterium]
MSFSLRFTRSSLFAWLMCPVLFMAGMALFNSHNHFPYYYHPDEKGKVRQIAEHTRNCNHPLMMLTATNLVAQFHKGPLTFQQIVEKGRTVSAFFTAMAAVFMALLAWRMGGAPVAAALAGLSAGIFILLDVRIYFLSHFMKEDPALIMGMALTFLSLHVFWKRRDEASVLFVGASTAAAVSGKYIGWLLVPFVIWLIHAGCEPAARKHYRKLLFRGFGLTWAVLNYSIIFDPLQTFSSLGREMKGVIRGHHGLTKQVPHADYLRMFWDIPMTIKLFFGLYAAGLLLRLKKTSPAEWLVPGFSLLLMVMMSFSPKSSARYFIPVEMVVCFGAGLGLVWFSSTLASLFGRARTAVLILVWAALLAVSVKEVVPLIQEYYRALAVDDRLELKAWVTANLPASAVIAQDDRVHLSQEGDPTYPTVATVPQRILNSGFVADLGTLEELRSRGVTHVAIASQKFLIFDAFTPSSKKKDEFTRRKRFYASLGAVQNSKLQDGVKQVWKSQIGTVIYLQPGIRLFDITGVAPSASVTPATPSAPASPEPEQETAAGI